MAEVEQAFNDAVARRVFPGATAVVRKGAEVVFEGAFGHRTLMPDPREMKLETVFDLSSLTKVFATTIAVMMIARDGQAAPRRSRDAVFPELRSARQGSRHLSPSARALLGAGGVAAVL